MAIQHLSSGDIASVLPLGAQLAQTPTTALLKEKHLEVMRLVLPAGKRVPPHAVDGPITVQCLEGEVDFGVENDRRRLVAGDLLYLGPGVRHDLIAVANASLLVTVVLLPSS